METALRRGWRKEGRRTVEETILVIGITEALLVGRYLRGTPGRKTG